MPSKQEALRTVCLGELEIAALTTPQLMTQLESSMRQREGGWLVTVNLDMLRLAHVRDDVRQLYSSASLRVADGMPLVWAARAQGSDLPERIAGSSITLPLIELCANNGWSVAFLGGAAGDAELAAARLRESYPALTLSADSSLQFSSSPTPEEVSCALSALGDAQLVFVGLGSPKQEVLISKLRDAMPNAWMIGIGGTFSFLAGTVPRAPLVMQRLGLEWVHRLAQEPRRLAKRYLLHDLPFGVQLMAKCYIARGRAR